VSVDNSCQIVGDLLLCVGEVGAIGVELFRPNAGPSLGVDQQHIQRNLFTSSSNIAFEDITDPELTADLLSVDGHTLIRKGGIASDYHTSGDLREIGGQVFGDAICEIFLGRIVR